METGAERGRDEGNREETIRKGELAPKSGKRTPAVMRAPSTGAGGLVSSLPHSLTHHGLKFLPLPRQVGTTPL